MLVEGCEGEDVREAVLEEIARNSPEASVRSAGVTSFLGWRRPWSLDMVSMIR